MAKVTYTSPLESINGSIGSLTFQQNASGYIVRRRPRAARTVSINQQIAESVHIKLLHEFTNLSVINKNLWKAYGNTYTKIDKWNNTKKLTGQQWFLSINYYQLLINSTILLSPPAYEVPDVIDGLNLILSYDKIIIDFTNSKTTTNTNVMIYATAPVTGSIQSSRPLYKYLMNVDFNVLGLCEITDIWKIRFNLNWPVNIDNLDFNIGIMCYVVNNVSGISGAGMTAYNNLQYGKYGIGDAIIESTFFVY